MTDSPKQANSGSHSAFSRFLQPSVSSSLAAPSTPSIQSDARSSGWSSYFLPATSSAPHQPTIDATTAITSPPDNHTGGYQDAFPFPNLALRSSLSLPKPKTPLPQRVTSQQVSQHFSVPITSSKGGQRPSPLIDIALSPSSGFPDAYSDSASHVAVLSRTSLKIMDMRPRKTSPTAQSTYASAVSSNHSQPPRNSSVPIAKEVMDVKLGTKLPKYSFTSVAWGYTSSANCLATGGADGSVLLWDVAMDGQRSDASRKRQSKAQHDRAVNQVAFAGPNGLWLISAGQDGAIKLWVGAFCPKEYIYFFLIGL